MAPLLDVRRTLSPVPRQRLIRGTSFPEIECVRHLLPLGFAEIAEWRSVQVGIGADRVLVAAGHITEDTYLRALAADLGIDFEPLEDIEREACPLTDGELAQATVSGLLPLRIGHERVYVLSPRGFGARILSRLVQAQPATLARFRLTSAERLARFTAEYGMGAMGQRAADFLKVREPLCSAATSPRFAVVAMFALAFLGLGTFTAPSAMMTAAGIGLSIFFMAWIAFRVAAVCVPPHAPPEVVRIPDDQLPTYTIVVALYREAGVVGDLVRALRKLDYPPEKLQVLLVLEPDDHDTQEAIARLRPGVPFEVVVAPDIGPRTKPKALNVALSLARGAYMAVYDAEDRPAPDQLRRAIAAFIGDERLACVQARLTIDNTNDSFLTRLFTAEYAGLFDVFLPAIASRHLPLPLGGSSNHFRTPVLRAVGGWDPYNVTEDADLGMRLARRGFRTAMIDSTTYEEAPAHLGPWLRQRTRWFKGWLQTWLVHMRQPRQLLRDLGLEGFLTFQLVVGGTVLAALIHPVFALLFSLGLLDSPAEMLAGVTTVTGSLYLVTLVAGYFTSVLLGAVGLARRGLASTIWWLVLTPAHWVLLSIAAWRALIQLVRDPHRWEKTDHGHARTSRLSPRMQAEEKPIRDSVSDRPPRPQASALG